MARLLAAVALLLLAPGCPPPARVAPAHHPAAPTGRQPWAGGTGSVCEPGQVNDLGVGKGCNDHADCAGLPAAMCHAVKGPDRPKVCTVHCETDADCGPDAMCGLSRGWIRSCYPKRCTDFAYAPERRRPADGPPPAHKGAAICDPGFSFYEAEGWGAACAAMDSCGDRAARACNAAVYPPGVPRCARECRTDDACGANAYCGYTEVETFTLCAPRCPDPRHRAMAIQPGNLERCMMAGSIVDLSSNRYGVGQACTPGAACGDRGLGVCGPDVPTARRPLGCTRRCQADQDCGLNALCVDLEHGLPPAARSGQPSQYCVPACWGV